MRVCQRLAVDIQTSDLHQSAYWMSTFSLCGKCVMSDISRSCQSRGDAWLLCIFNTDRVTTQQMSGDVDVQIQCSASVKLNSHF